MQPAGRLRDARSMLDAQRMDNHGRWEKDVTAEAKQPAEPKADPRDLALAILVGALLSPFVGMLRALTYRLFWDWFVAPQYGDGPTLQTWFGIGTLVTLLKFRQETSSKGFPRNPVRLTIESAIVGILILGGAIVAAAMARVIWGWR